MPEIYTCSHCESSPIYKRALGHDGPPAEDVPMVLWRKHLITDEVLERCPVRTMLLAEPVQIAEAERLMHEFFPAYQDGHLLVAGGIADQPARYLDAMRLIKNLEVIVDAKARAAKQEEDSGN